MSKLPIMINTSAVIKACIFTRILTHFNHINAHRKNQYDR